MNRLLLIEDSPDAYRLAQRTLGSSFDLQWAPTHKDACRLLEQKTFDLILMDVMLPDGDGFQLCSILHAHPKWSEIPVMFVTAKTSVSDRVLGFSVGAEDFIAKPYDPIELKARVDSKLKKRQRLLDSADTIVVDDLEIDKRSQRATVNENGNSRELELTPLEFRLLVLLASRPNTVLSRAGLLDNVWGKDVHVYQRSVDTHISKLRKKLGERSSYIESVHGTGYRFVTVGEKRTNALAESFKSAASGGLAAGFNS